MMHSRSEIVVFNSQLLLKAVNYRLWSGDWHVVKLCSLCMISSYILKSYGLDIQWLVMIEMEGACFIFCELFFSFQILKNSEWKLMVNCRAEGVKLCNIKVKCN